MASDGSGKVDKDGGETKEKKSGMGGSAKMAATVIVTATVLSPGVRSVLRQGAVRGLAGVLVLGDALASFARGIGRGIQDVNAVAGDTSPSAASASAVAAAEEAARAAREAARVAQEAAQAAREASSAARKKPRRPRPPAPGGGEEPNG
ncbi:MAG TPA: hypothetical protein VE913_19270 [Longimicrobium sp.]|nr:hypothetical protein [Longimicrobium sp.]